MFFYVLNIHVNFRLNRILFTIQSINLFLYIIFYHKNLIFKHQLFDLQALFGFLFSSLITYHSIFITHHLNFPIVCGSHTCNQSKAISLPAHLFLFSHFPFPLQPCHSPKARTRTHKNFSSFLASSGPSPVNNTHLSDMYGSMISSVMSQQRQQA